MFTGCIYKYKYECKYKPAYNLAERDRVKWIYLWIGWMFTGCIYKYKYEGKYKPAYNLGERDRVKWIYL